MGFPRISGVRDARRIWAQGLAVSLMAFAAGTLGLPAAAVAAPNAKPSCRASEALLVTYGDDEYMLSTRDTDGERPEPESIVDPELRIGLARGTTPLLVRTARDRRGRGRPSLCRGGKSIAALPSLGKGQFIGGASVSGTFVTWRVWTPGSRGRLHVARVQAGRLRARRSVSVPSVARRYADDGRISVAPSGDAAWALATRPSGAWVWPRAPLGRRVVRLSRALDDVGVNSIRFLDEQHVDVNDDGQWRFRFRPPVPGRCPRLAAGSWSPIGPWQVAAIAGVETEGTSSTLWTGRVTVCDPDRGEYIAFYDERFDSTQYGMSTSYVTRLVQSGPWLVAEAYRDGHYVTQIHDARIDGAGASPTTPVRSVIGAALGRIEGNTLPNPSTGSVPPTAVAVTPGAVAWIRTDGEHPRRTGIVLADAAGLRQVGSADLADQPSPSIGFTDGHLTWSDGNVSHAVGVRPEPGGMVTLGAGGWK